MTLLEKAEKLYRDEHRKGANNHGPLCILCHQLGPLGGEHDYAIQFAVKFHELMNSGQ